MAQGENGERERGEPLKGKSRKTYQNLITLQKYCTLQLERDAGYVLKQESKTDDLASLLKTTLPINYITRIYPQRAQSFEVV